LNPADTEIENSTLSGAVLFLAKPSRSDTIARNGRVGAKVLLYAE